MIHYISILKNLTKSQYQGICQTPRLDVHDAENAKSVIHNRNLNKTRKYPQMQKISHINSCLNIGVPLT